MAPRDLKLPVTVIGQTDVGRLIRELKAIDEQLLQLSIRQPGSEVKLSKTTQIMDQLVSTNKLNLLQPSDRAWLLKALEAIRQHAPILHMSFSADPSAKFLEKLIVWLRREIHPFVLLGIGLQPNLAAGCIVRSTNKVFDFSLRQNFATKRDLLKQALVATPALPPTPAASPEVTT